MFREQGTTARLLVDEDPLDLLVDQLGRVVAVLTTGEEVVSQEYLAPATPGHRADALAHAPFPDHLAGQLGGADQVVAGAGGGDAEDELLGHPPTEAHDERVLDEVLPVEVPLLLRQLHGHAESHAAGDDRHLVQGVGGGKHGGTEGMARLVVGDGLFLARREGQRLTLLAHEGAIPGLLEVVGLDGVLAGADRDQGGLVHEVGQVGTAHARRAACEQVQVDVVAYPLALDVDVQDLPTVVQFGERHDHLAVEPARPQQGGIQDVRSVGGSDHHDALAGFEAVHLRQHLVQRLLPLVVPAAHAGAALASDRVDLVDEDDGPAHLARRLEQVADPAGPHAHEHLHEVGTGDREEWHPGLAGHGPGDERLACSRRSDQQHALGDAGADLGELLGVLQEVHDLADLHLHALVAGHVVERRAGAFRRVGLGPRPAYRHHPAHLALGPALDPPEEQDDHADR